MGWVGKRQSGEEKRKLFFDHLKRRKALKSETLKRWELKEAFQGMFGYDAR